MTLRWFFGEELLQIGPESPLHSNASKSGATSTSHVSPQTRPAGSKSGKAAAAITAASVASFWETPKTSKPLTGWFTCLSLASRMAV